MPHDVYGNPLAIGDRVSIPATVKGINSGDEYCNLDVEFEHPMPSTNRVRYSALNSREVEKALVLGVACAEAGEAAYSAYREASGGKSLVSGAPIPEWAQLAPAIQNGWRAAAAAAARFAGADLSVTIGPVSATLTTAE